MCWQTGVHAPRIVAAIIAGLGAVTAVLIGVLAGFVWTPLLWLQLPLWLAGLWGVCIYPARWAKRNGGELKNGYLYIRRGVCFKKEWQIPLTALRSMEWWEPPLHRLAGCRTLILRYAGGTVCLPLLPRTQAVALWERLETEL